jgi:hypothetical protein
LDKVAGALTPQEAVLAWMAEAHGCGSLNAYLETLRGAPQERFPLVRLQDQMEQAVGVTRVNGDYRRSALKPEERHALRFAVRDVGFLYILASNLNWRLVERRRAHWLHVALCGTMLRLAVADESARELARARDQVEEALATACIQQGTVATIERRYFSGASALFPDIAADVAALVTATERTVQLGNDLVGIFTAPAPQRRDRTKVVAPPPDPGFTPLDCAAVRAQCAAAIEAEVSLQVDLAKAEALDLIGEREAGYPLVARHVWPRD